MVTGRRLGPSSTIQNAVRVRRDECQSAETRGDRTQRGAKRPTDDGACGESVFSHADA